MITLIRVTQFQAKIKCGAMMQWLKKQVPISTLVSTVTSILLTCEEKSRIKTHVTFVRALQQQQVVRYMYDTEAVDRDLC